MSWLAYLISVAVVGLITGALARLALPGRDPMSLLQTMLVGIAGAFIAGLIVYIISGGRYYGAGWFISFVFSVAIVYFIRRRRGGGLTDPGYGNSPGPFGSSRSSHRRF
jgi:uncharacterized membrane protein YeaQ/YmgE (transglycosylase-associated protein family)